MRTQGTGRDVRSETGPSYNTFLQQTRPKIIELGVRFPFSTVRKRLGTSATYRPQGIDVKTLAARSPWLVDICKREGFRFRPRLQIELFGLRVGRNPALVGTPVSWPS